MKIAIVCNVPDPRKGGAQVWTGQFIQWIAEQGHEVHLICQQGKTGSIVSPARLHRLAARTRYEFATAAETRVSQLDVDVAHDMGCGWYGDIHHSHVGSPVAFRQIFDSLRPWYRRLSNLSVAALLPRYRETKRLIDRQFSSRRRETVFIALSRRVASDFVTLHGIPSRQIELIPNGVDVNQFTPPSSPVREQIRASMGIRSDETVLLQIAHDHYLKGVPDLLDAGARLIRRGQACRIVVVGREASHSKRQHVKRMGIEANVHFVGKTEEILSFYQMADIYVHPTLYDACSLSVLEAMACGLPVITVRQNGAADLIQHARDGFVFDRQDTAALDRHLQTLFDRDIRQRVAMAARERAEQLTLEQNFQTFLRLYERIAHRKRGHLDDASDSYRAHFWRMRVPASGTAGRTDEAPMTAAEDLTK